MTKRFLGAETRLTQLEGCEVKWQKTADDWKLKEIPGSEFSCQADLVILAMGFLHVAQEGLVTDLELKLDGSGNVVADNFQTSQPWVFAAGDTVSGASLVVSAIDSGRQAAAAIDKWLVQSR